MKLNRTLQQNFDKVRFVLDELDTMAGYDTISKMKSGPQWYANKRDEKFRYASGQENEDFQLNFR